MIRAACCRKVERFGQNSLVGDELHTMLLHEARITQLVDHLKPLEHPKSFRYQRLTNMVSRKMLAFKECYIETLLSDQRRGRGSRRSATNNNYISRIGLAIMFCAFEMRE